MIGREISRVTSRVIGRVIDRVIGREIDRVTSQVIDRVIGREIDRVIDREIDLEIDLNLQHYRLGASNLPMIDTELGVVYTIFGVTRFGSRDRRYSDVRHIRQ